ncbi:Metallo-dependent phosphatase [Epithele typhae]|uniref:Metallo-dependent phosphatase n=1 Tax=Epithele typhae TaxID=378194 RepID=UPI0020077D9A|nr:Metallo-dependent phosphatase [Epithele typhae]KAH9945176.1 Metallo-dependent phosphatase [Epithele typhae]
MPRFFTFLAIFLPILAALFLYRSSIDLRALGLPLTWPLAAHPDQEHSLHFNQGSDQQPFQPIDAIDTAVHSARPTPSAPVVPSHVPDGTYTRRIVAVGDLHGDMPNAQEVLHMAGVVDEHGNWSGNVDFFVQTGDIIDRGDDTIKLYTWMDQLRDQARAVGGTVLSHLGNHEWMNAIGDWRYVYPSELMTFGSIAARQRELSVGHIGRSWAANYSTASRLPLHQLLGPPNLDFTPGEPGYPLSPQSPVSHAAISFCHGGLAPSYPDLSPFPSRINELGASLLKKLQHRPQPAPHPPYPYPGLPADATLAEQRMYGADGPLWYRGWALDPEEKVCKEVDDVLQRTGTRRMVMGHTPDFQKIVSRCGGKIIIIDTGISHAYGGALSALSITYTLTPESDESGMARWSENEVVKAVYQDREEVLANDTREIVGSLL